MRILDRYLVALYIKVLLIWFLSLAGLYIVIDAMGNFDEFASYGKRSEGGIVLVLADYYSARMLWFFDRTSGMLAMLASIFVATRGSRLNAATIFSPVHQAIDLQQMAQWMIDDRLDRVRFGHQLHKTIWGAEAKGV